MSPINSEEIRLVLQHKWPKLTSHVTILQRLIRWVEIDRAIIYGIIRNLSQMLSVPVTWYLIATRFSPSLQGYYFTFSNVLALRIFVELGLTNVIVQFASHEWSKLNLDVRGKITGDPEALSRLVSLGRIVFLWYLIGGVIAFVGICFGGYFFFSQSTALGINWLAPWFVLCILCGIEMWLIPAWSLLEGCNQISRVYAFRMVQGILINLSVWIAILLGVGLWAAVVSASIGIIVSGIFLAYRHWYFLRAFFFERVGPRMNWRHDIWPMQWRVALSWLSGYFMASVFAPILFHYHGSIVAGQMGMTQSLLFAIGTISSLWLTTKAPRFGMLIAKKQYVSLDRLFFRVTIIALAITLCGSIILWLVVYFLSAISHPLSTRILPPSLIGLYQIGGLAIYATYPFSVYLRAHKREPFMGLSIISGILIGLSAWILGSRYSATGIVAGYFAVALFFVFPYGIFVWRRCRIAWHKNGY
jgi:hypothetical protein